MPIAPIVGKLRKRFWLDLTTSLHPDKGQKHAILNAVYKQPSLHTRAFLDVFKVRAVSRSRWGWGA